MIKIEVLEEFKKYLIEKYNYNDNSNTISAYLSDIKQFINYFKEQFDEDIIDFSRANVIEFKNELLEKRNLKCSSVNRKMASLSIYENFLIDNEIRKEQKKIIRDNDFYKITRPYVTADMLPRNTIKKVRLKAGTVSKRDYALFVLLHEGGLRISEALNLQLERDIDFEMFTILILGKGNKVRKIYMSEIIVDALKDYIEEREKLLNGRVNKYLFVSNKTANTNKPMNRTSINKILENYCKLLNESKINPHILRHDCGTLMYEEGCTEIMIKKKLGHSSNAVDIYTHPNLQMLKNKKNVDICSLHLT